MTGKINKNHIPEKKERYQLDYFAVFLAILTFAVILYGIINIVTGLKSENETYFDKKIKNEISIAIKNGADLNVIKNIYRNRIIIEKSINPFSSVNTHLMYKSETPLSIILEDIISDIFIPIVSDAAIDTIGVYKIKKIIEFNNQTNPFDKLEQNQKSNFENIQAKILTQYPIIQNDLSKISDDLNSKNNLVNTYLDKSTQSFWISAAGLSLSLILGIIQLISYWFNRGKNKELYKLLKTISNNSEVE
jgi:hypothetical protein